MAYSISLKETRVLIEEFFDTKTELGTKKNIHCWLGLDPKITMEDIYMKKNIERMNILGIDLKVLKEKAETYLDRTEIKDGKVKIKVPDFFETRKITQELKEFTKRIKTEKESYDKVFLEIMELENKNESEIARLINTLFYRIGVVKGSFAVTEGRIVDGKLFFNFTKENCTEREIRENYTYRTTKQIESELKTKKETLIKNNKAKYRKKCYNENFMKEFEEEMKRFYCYKRIIKTLKEKVFDGISEETKRSLDKLFQNEWILNKYIKEKNNRKENFNLIMGHLIFEETRIIPITSKKGDLLLKNENVYFNNLSRTLISLKNLFIKDFSFNIGGERLFISDFKNFETIEVFLKKELTEEQFKKIKKIITEGIE